MQSIPPIRRIPGSKQTLSDNLTASVLIDRMCLLEVGKNVLLLLTKEEANALYLYLERHHIKFLGAMGEQP